MANFAPDSLVKYGHNLQKESSLSQSVADHVDGLVVVDVGPLSWPSVKIAECSHAICCVSLIQMLLPLPHEERLLAYGYQYSTRRHMSGDLQRMSKWVKPGK